VVGVLHFGIGFVLGPAIGIAAEWHLCTVLDCRRAVGI
jgi:hypothetical protein